jgi:hypothetical protein
MKAESVEGNEFFIERLSVPVRINATQLSPTLHDYSTEQALFYGDSFTLRSAIASLATS